MSTDSQVTFTQYREKAFFLPQFSNTHKNPSALHGYSFELPDVASLPVNAISTIWAI